MSDDERQCPYCGKMINKYEKKCPFCGELSEAEPSFICPYCGEKNSIKSQQCEYCGELLKRVEYKSSVTICPYCGNENIPNAKKCRHCGEWIKPKSNDKASNIANMQMASSIIWLIISGLMILNGINNVSYNAFQGISCIVVGIYNIIITCSILVLPEKIRNLDADILSCYENIAPYIAMIVVNILLGWYIGVILGIFDLYIRKVVMDNKYLFLRSAE